MDLRPARWARAFTFEMLGVSRRSRARLDGSRAAVLMYHRVLPRAQVVRDAVEPGMYVSPDTFAHHLSWLDAYFRVLPLAEIVTRTAAGQPLPPGACAITFDDGWRDNGEHAVPELQRRGLPATIFVVTGRVGTSGAFWPDEVSRRLQPLARPEQQDLARRLGVSGDSRDAAGALVSHLKALPDAERQAALDALRAQTPLAPCDAPELLDWDELDRVARAGIDVEAHGATHAILSTLPPAQAEWELRTALATLRERGHGRHGLLAYPNGGHDAQVRRIAADAGFRAAVTTQAGLLDAGTDRMAIPRVAVHDDVSRTRVEFLHVVPGRA